MKTCICVIIKDENDYLKEWLDYHLKIGIDEIYLYEDYNSQSHRSIVESYNKTRVHLFSIDVIYQKGFFYKDRLRQEHLFIYFGKVYKKEFDWILFIDIDEFLILNEPLEKLLKDYEDKPAILLYWKYYGASNHIKKPLGKVMDNFINPIASSFDYGWKFKSFYNCKYDFIWEQRVHKIKGGVFPINEYGLHKAYLNHYFTKSWEEWKNKLLLRGDCSLGHRKIQQFFRLNPDLEELKEDLLKEIS